MSKNIYEIKSKLSFTIAKLCLALVLLSFAAGYAVEIFGCGFRHTGLCQQWGIALAPSVLFLIGGVGAFIYGHILKKLSGVQLIAKSENEVVGDNLILTSKILGFIALIAIPSSPLIGPWVCDMKLLGTCGWLDLRYFVVVFFVTIAAAIMALVFFIVGKSVKK